MASSVGSRFLRFGEGGGVFGASIGGGQILEAPGMTGHWEEHLEQDWASDFKVVTLWVVLLQACFWSAEP